MLAVSHNIASALWRTARCWPRLPALALGSAVLLDYGAFAERVSRVAAGMRDAGVSPGDRIALVARNAPEYIEVLFAAWWAGAVAVPINAKLHPKELAFVLSDSGARWAFVDAAWQAALSAEITGGTSIERVIALDDAQHRALRKAEALGHPHACALDDAAWLFYTSGTTGRPKGVVITHDNLLAMAQCYFSDVDGVVAGDALLHPAPLSHGSGLYTVPHVLAGAVNVVPESGAFDAQEIAAMLDAWRRASFFAAPTMVKRLVSSAALAQPQIESLKCLVYGGGPMYIADCRAAFERFGARLAQIYGQGESPMTITAMSRPLLTDAMARNDVARLASVGVAQTGIEVRVAGTDGRTLEPGDAGEVLVRGRSVMREYWGNAKATAATLAGGWLHTGDVGSMDADGFLTLKDRSKDLIISGGTNIYPREVEEVLLLHADVQEAAVVGKPHAEWGEEVVAFIVGRAGVDCNALAASLDRHCLDNIARFKRPRHYRFVDELPKNNTGKVLKTALREQLQK